MTRNTQLFSILHSRTVTYYLAKKTFIDSEWSDRCNGFTMECVYFLIHNIFFVRNTFSVKKKIPVMTFRNVSGIQLDLVCPVLYKII